MYGTYTLSCCLSTNYSYDMGGLKKNAKKIRKKRRGGGPFCTRLKARRKEVMVRLIRSSTVVRRGFDVPEKQEHQRMNDAWVFAWCFPGEVDESGMRYFFFHC